ncbi:response regulator transcription factor [Fodinisporobacter ferrooxydans]|uniref:Response regulator transcription factor n=1 Tax=Fodinisporobacter ferrooxydans TaxID=2901836 RepID=A0ABY4CP19_9BACL|nr:response regulator transcription factor [Alicyclobacillaceae bacterium MYW30-H2]
MSFKLLVYSNESYIATMLRHTLSPKIFGIETVYDCYQLNAIVKHRSFALVIMHVHEGTQAEYDCCRMFGETYDIPFIVITGSLNPENRLQLLRLGALDCLTEDCKLEELTVRIQNVLRFVDLAERRAAEIRQPQPIIHLSDALFVNQQFQYVMRHGEQQYLSPIEFRLLKYLIEHCNEIVDSEHLLQVGWGAVNQSGRDELYVYIRSLRKKLDVPGHPSCIKSFYGKGYLLHIPRLAAATQDEKSVLSL